MALDTEQRRLLDIGKAIAATICPECGYVKGGEKCAEIEHEGFVLEPGEICPACGEETWEWYGTEGQTPLCMYCHKDRPSEPAPKPAAYFRLGGRRTRYDTLAEATAAASAYHARTGNIVGIEQFPRDKHGRVLS